MKYKVWYFRHERAAQALFGYKGFINPDNLEETHIFLMEKEAPSMEQLYHWMQAESWSPNGEARPLIERLDLTHTSMSMDDVIVDEAGDIWTVAMFGFDKIGKVTA